MEKLMLNYSVISAFIQALFWKIVIAIVVYIIGKWAINKVCKISTKMMDKKGVEDSLQGFLESIRGLTARLPREHHQGWSMALPDYCYYQYPGCRYRSIRRALCRSRCSHRYGYVGNTWQLRRWCDDSSLQAL